MIPRRKPGRQSKAAIEQFDRELKDFIQLLIGVNNKIDFKASARGWCYILEPYGLDKGEFDYAETLINGCRKTGLLPNNFMASEDARKFNCIEGAIDDETPEEFAEAMVESIKYVHEAYHPWSVWDDQKNYVQMLVEKIDLRSLFEPICEEYKIPIATARGWSSIRQRKEMIFRFQDYECEGKTPVLLYCGDFDPGGLSMSNYLKSNLDDLYKATGWTTENLIIDRFGLNYDFIIENNLSWIDNLQTGKKKGVNDLADPRHKDHFKPYVQGYIKQYGPRKVEANAIVVAPNMGRRVCRDSINKYIDQESISKYRNLISVEQKKVRREVQRIMNEL